MVRTRPIRAASREARSAEIPAKIFAQKKIAPSVDRFNAKAQIEPIRGKTLHHKSARKRIEGEETRQFQDDIS